MRIEVRLVTLLALLVLAGTAQAAARCADGDVRACKRADGTAGLQACVEGMWGSCNVAGGGGGAGAPQPPRYQPADCPPESERQTIRITMQDGDNEHLVTMLRSAVSTPNRLVLLARDVQISFARFNPIQGEALLQFAECVTLASFDPTKPAPGGVARRSRPPAALAAGASGTPPGTPPAIGTLYTSGRTPVSPGPALFYGDGHDPEHLPPMIGITCLKQEGGASISAEGARISGLQLVGPRIDDHHTGEVGMLVLGCHDVDISNIEARGWGNAAIQVQDLVTDPKALAAIAPTQVLLRIHDSYIHHNQNSTHSDSLLGGLFGQGHALGYGVEVDNGAFVEIYRNLFDFNRHSITAGAGAGGYHASDNLFLKGGGYHNGLGHRDIHIVDVHGSDTCFFLGIQVGAGNGFLLGIVAGLLVAGVLLVVGLPGWAIAVFVVLTGAGLGIGWKWGDHPTTANCGDAGYAFTIDHNTFQYAKTTDIKFRGTPVGWTSHTAPTTISSNVFPFGKDKAIDLENADAVDVRPDNMYNTDTFGHYGVCDVDGDGVDDLVLMTGVTWWYSAQGMRPWWFLRRENRIPQGTDYGEFQVTGLVRLGDFDGDGKCDALTDAGGGVWLISRGLAGHWETFGNYLAPLADVQFGRFDPNQAEAHPVMRHPVRRRHPITHVFWRGEGGFWLVTPLGQPHLWTVVGSSSFPLSELRFGDFTGDSVTDVLAIEQGHWSISASARSQWQTLNGNMNQPVKAPNIYIANMDSDDDIDDVLRLDQQSDQGHESSITKTLAWQRSQNGTGNWQQWRAPYRFEYKKDNPDFVDPSFGFVGRFSADANSVTMVIDENRQPHFFSQGRAEDAAKEWTGDFRY
jgi:hypothetical protein